MKKILLSMALLLSMIGCGEKVASNTEKLLVFPKEESKIEEMVTNIYKNELLQDLSKPVELISVKYEGTDSNKFTRTLDADDTLSQTLYTADGVAIWQVNNVLESDNSWLIVNVGNEKYKELYLEENEEGEFEYVVKDAEGLYIPVAKK
jgi:hypothetical protein